MSRVSKSTSQSWMILLGLGVLSFLFSLFPPVAKQLRQFRVESVTTIDRQAASFLSYITTFKMKLVNDMDLPSKLSTLEQYNRTLSAQVVEDKQRIFVLEQACAATASAGRKTAAVTSSFLSKVDGKWIILSGLSDGIQTGQLVLLDNVYLGSVETVMPTFSVIGTLGEMQTPMLVLHENSRELGLLTLEKGKLLVRFSAKINGISEKDSIISVPDGKNSTLSYLVGKVTTLSTTAADSVSIVEIKAEALPKVGKRIDVVSIKN